MLSKASHVKKKHPSIHKSQGKKKNITVACLIEDDENSIKSIGPEIAAYKIQKNAPASSAKRLKRPILRNERNSQTMV